MANNKHKQTLRNGGEVSPIAAANTLKFTKCKAGDFKRNKRLKLFSFLHTAYVSVRQIHKKHFGEWFKMSTSNVHKVDGIDLFMKTGQTNFAPCWFYADSGEFVAEVIKANSEKFDTTKPVSNMEFKQMVCEALKVPEAFSKYNWNSGRKIVPKADATEKTAKFAKVVIKTLANMAAFEKLNDRKLTEVELRTAIAKKSEKEQLALNSHFFPQKKEEFSI